VLSWAVRKWNSLAHFLAVSHSEPLPTTPFFGVMTFLMTAPWTRSPPPAVSYLGPAVFNPAQRAVRGDVPVFCFQSFPELADGAVSNFNGGEQ